MSELNDNARIATVQEIIRSYDQQCWLLYSEEHSDPYFAKIVSDKTISPAICVIFPDGGRLILHALDADNVPVARNLTKIVYKKEFELWEKLSEVLRCGGWPKSVSLSYSTLRDAQVDILGHGLYCEITKRVSEAYGEEGLELEFESAEKLIYAFFDRKTDDEIRGLKLAARRADEILREAMKGLRSGMSEKEVVVLVHSIMKEKPPYLAKAGVVAEEFAWKKDFCPVVLAGPSLVKGGHAMPSDVRIQPGYTVYFDFGVQLAFENGTKCSSDIQRMGYLLKKGEAEAPVEVREVFETLRESISLGIAAMKPGIRGHEVDKIVRSFITERGYPDYNHATGHAIGELAHNPGALLGPAERGLSSLELQPNGVYTLEPRIAVENGGSVEEMVCVQSGGAVSLSPRQEELHLVDAGRS